MIVVLDPGHGGVDGGARATNAAGEAIVDEADLVLGYATELGALLTERGKVSVEFTRGRQVFGNRMLLADRGSKAREAKADLVVSLHANSAIDPKAKGAIVFYAPTSAVAKNLAADIYRRLPAVLQSRTHGVQPATKEAWPRVHNCLHVYPMPAVLVELGFLSNSDEAFYLTRPETTREVVRALADAIEAAKPERP